MEINPDLMKEFDKEIDLKIVEQTSTKLIKKKEKPSTILSELQNIGSNCKEENNPPNATFMVESLRNIGYTSYTAIGDILDNSLDAGASVISVFISGDGKIKQDDQIVFVDNGCGMDMNKLKQALKYGSDTKKTPGGCGKFGFGMKTALTSQGRKFKVITKTLEDETPGIAIFDVNRIKKENDFVVGFGESTPEEKEIFENFIKDSNQGTIIILSDLDSLDDYDRTRFQNKIKKYIGKTFKKFIDAEKEFYMNSEKIDSYDPLWLDHPKTEIFAEYEEFYEDKTPISVKFVITPEQQELEPYEGTNELNYHKAGLYVYRNNRLVDFGGYFGQINHRCTRCRAEICFTDEYDQLLGIEINKNGTQPVQSLLDKIHPVIHNNYLAIKRKVDANRTKEELDDEDVKDVEKKIARKNGLLIKPDTPPVKRKKRGPYKKTEAKLPEREKYRLPINTRFSVMAWRPDDVLFDFEQVGKKLHIMVNGAHAFYKKYMKAEQNHKTMKEAILFLLYAFGNAEMIEQGRLDKDKENLKKVEHFKDIRAEMSLNISKNLRILSD